MSLREFVSPPADLVYPKVLSEIRPVFPGDGYEHGNQVILLETLVTEHGTASNVRITEGPKEARSFHVSAIGAVVSLWRFQPALRSGCPVPALVTVELAYKVSR